MLLIHSATTAANEPYPHGDGKLSLYNYHLNEHVAVDFKKDGISKLNLLLRSRDNEQAINIDPRLYDLLDHLQDHFAADTIEIISGFRSQELNDKLLSSGHKVSPVSLHRLGQALDIHIDEVSEEKLRDYLRTLKLGGVGYYGPLDFVHVDVGPVRYWEEPLGARKLIGVLNPKAPVQVTSDANEYFPQNKIATFVIKGADKPLGLVNLELFRKGKWEILKQLSRDTRYRSYLTGLGVDLAPFPFGKYRITFFAADNSKEILSSNEFYFKKL